MHFTDAIVLSRADVGEADAVFSLYTKDFGKIRGRAQGVKKENAKLRGHLETLALSRVGFVAGKNGERLVYAEALETWPAIREDFERMRAGIYCVALIDRATFAGAPDIEIWNLLERALRELNEQGLGNESLETFEKNLVRYSGYGDSGDISILGLRAAGWV